MAVKVIPYGLLELMIRRPFLEPLIEEMSQVLVQLSSFSLLFIFLQSLKDVASPAQYLEHSGCSTKG